jgi:putative membrane protein
VLARIFCTLLAINMGSAMAEMSGPSQGPSSSTSAGPTAPANHQLRQADKAFLQNAQEVCMAAVQGSKLALDKSTNMQVRHFAQRVLDEHTDTRNKLDALAEAKGVEVPESPSLTQRAKLVILSLRDGSSFDQNYVESVGVSAHQDAIELFQKAATTSSDPDVRAFANDTLPLLQHDLDVAKTLQAATKQDEFEK